MCAEIVPSVHEESVASPRRASGKRFLRGGRLPATAPRKTPVRGRQGTALALLADAEMFNPTLPLYAQPGGEPMLAVKIIALWVLLSLLGPSSCQGNRLNGSTTTGPPGFVAPAAHKL